jgi:hypothetical protein
VPNARIAPELAERRVRLDACLDGRVIHEDSDQLQELAHPDDHLRRHRGVPADAGIAPHRTQLRVPLDSLLHGGILQQCLQECAETGRTGISGRSCSGMIHVIVAVHLLGTYAGCRCVRGVRIRRRSRRRCVALVRVGRPSASARVVRSVGVMSRSRRSVARVRVGRPSASARVVCRMGVMSRRRSGRGGMLCMIGGSGSGYAFGLCMSGMGRVIIGALGNGVIPMEVTGGRTMACMVRIRGCGSRPVPGVIIRGCGVPAVSVGRLGHRHLLLDG